MIARIQKIIHLKKMTSSAFADKIGVPRSTISHILSGRNNPSLEFVQKVLDSFPEIRTEWLVRGEGHMLKATNTLFPDEDFESITEANSSEIQKEKERGPLTVKQGNENQEKEDYSAKNEGKSKILESEGDKPLAQKEIIPDKKLKIESKITDISDKGEEKASRVLIFYANGTFSEHFPGA